ncbi:MAG: plastocyanin, partial [Methanomicrobiales archaeon]|nr:plastocyanin [Methanomicrobiales archaeon]
MRKVIPVLVSLLALALIVSAGAQQAGSSNISGTNGISGQIPGDAVDLTNAGSPLAATFESNESRTSLSPLPDFTADIGLELVG